ncbi:hypothetical protein QBC35DRAFT_116391 [Podospora australis]|uniref:Required for respiratory growth protein 9, mitochondrial n=1 Tax=Podospora australis TaxID=1536484 RepID=A0AAN6X1T7_9PEZI|nr:hypothetical protein QBC35DRAFT_116391 [Podospora australis]
MSTCCRTAALRIFVRSITQIHVPAIAKGLPQTCSTLSRTQRYSNLQRVLPTLGSCYQANSLHTSCVRNNAQPAAYGRPQQPEDGPPPGFRAEIHTDSHSATGTQTAGDGENAEAKPMGKWARKKARLARERAEAIARGDIPPDEEVQTKPPKQESTQTEVKAVNSADTPQPKKNGIWARKKARTRRAHTAGYRTKPKPAAAKSAEARSTQTKEQEEEAKAAADRIKRRKEKKEKQKAAKKEVDNWVPPRKEHWMVQKVALKEKFPEGWTPRKKLSPDALAGIKALHAQFPNEFTTAKLAEKFEVSPEAIRRILKSKWSPSAEEEEERQNRWFNRGKRVWAQWAEIGRKPPARWRAEGVTRHPIWNRPKAERGRIRVSARSRTAVRIEQAGTGPSKTEQRAGVRLQKRMTNSFLG